MPYFFRWKTIIVWLVVLLSIVVALPNAVSDATLDGLPSWVPKKQLMLGLDLQGGSQITLKVEREDVVRTRLEAVIDTIGARLRSAGIAYSGLSGTGQDIQLHLRNPAQLEAARTVLKPLTDPIKIGGVAKDAISEVAISGSADGSMSAAISDQGIAD
ncbi:MAG: protein translocase subunit SecDF, partial [Pararhizobium sp.]